MNFAIHAHPYINLSDIMREPSDDDRKEFTQRIFDLTDENFVPLNYIIDDLRVIGRNDIADALRSIQVRDVKFDIDLEWD